MNLPEVFSPQILIQVLIQILTLQHLKMTNQKQCSNTSGTCICVDTVTGMVTEPKREAPIKYRDALICNGTKCIAESQAVIKEIARLDEMGFVDHPLLPL